MKLLAMMTVAFGLAFPGSVALAQEQQGGEKKAGVEKEESFAEKHELGLKWANFLILAGVLGYFIGKNAGPFFAARSAGIRKDMDESLRQRQEAEAKAADVDRRLANLEKDIAALRGQSEAEGKAETEHMLSIRQMEAEIDSGEKTFLPLMTGAGRSSKFFRFPANHTGDTRAKHDAVAAFLL